MTRRVLFHKIEFEQPICALMKRTRPHFLPGFRLLCGLAMLAGALLLAQGLHATTVVGLWRFNEGSGTNVSDSSGLGNNGTLQSAGTTLPVWTNSQNGLG